MRTLHDVETEIIGIFAERFEMRLASADVDLLEGRLVDSLRLVDLVLELEQRFGVELPFEELEIEDFRSVALLAERIARSWAP